MRLELGMHWRANVGEKFLRGTVTVLAAGGGLYSITSLALWKMYCRITGTKANPTSTPTSFASQMRASSNDQITHWITLTTSGFAAKQYQHRLKPPCSTDECQTTSLLVLSSLQRGARTHGSAITRTTVVVAAALTEASQSSDLAPARSVCCC